MRKFIEDLRALSDFLYRGLAHAVEFTKSRLSECRNSFASCSQYEIRLSEIRHHSVEYSNVDKTTFRLASAESRLASICRWLLVANELQPIVL